REVSTAFLRPAGDEPVRTERAVPVGYEFQRPFCGLPAMSPCRLAIATNAAINSFQRPFCGLPAMSLGRGLDPIQVSYEIVSTAFLRPAGDEPVFRHQFADKGQSVSTAFLRPAGDEPTGA